MFELSRRLRRALPGAIAHWELSDIGSIQTHDFQLDPGEARGVVETRAARPRDKAWRCLFQTEPLGE